jgi:hypothetical protein
MSSRVAWWVALSTALTIAACAGFAILATSPSAKRCDLYKIRYRTTSVADVTSMNYHAFAFSDDMTQIHSTAKKDLTPNERACARGLSQHPSVVERRALSTVSNTDGTVVVGNDATSCAALTADECNTPKCMMVMVNGGNFKKYDKLYDSMGVNALNVVSVNVCATYPPECSSFTEKNCPLIVAFNGTIPNPCTTNPYPLPPCHPNCEIKCWPQ